MNATILVVDDEKEIADLVEVYMQNEGYNIIKAYDGKNALEKINSNVIDLAILDIMLPEIDGFKLCNIIREKYNFPVIMLTAKVDDIDKIKGLMIGADDYITKPFNPIELTARVKAHLRRYTKYNNYDDNINEIIDINDIVINKTTHECNFLEKKLQLTPTEFDILWYLCQNKGKVISSEELFENVWKEKYLDSNNTVMVHIRKIREKFESINKKNNIIKTVWGVGYKIE